MENAEKSPTRTKNLNIARELFKIWRANLGQIQKLNDDL